MGDDVTDYVDSRPTARKRHRCTVCWRWIMPGEDYWRQAGFDRACAWTHKTCAHCERVVGTYPNMGDEWDPDHVVEWLEDQWPGDYAAMLAGWRWPDGELVPLPFGSSCITCGVRIEWKTLWCAPCDEARIERLGRQLVGIGRDLGW